MQAVEFVIKRDGTRVSYEVVKVARVIERAMENVDQIDRDTAMMLAEMVTSSLSLLNLQTVSVDLIHSEVEKCLMAEKLYDVARAYITYRDAHKPDIFRERKEILPREYSSFVEYVEAINHSFWLHTEFNYNPDIQDFKVNMNAKEVSAATRAMLAISQIESAVKTFWGRLDMKLPKPEITSVGATFAESEVRHERAYSFLLEKLGLTEDFKKLKDVPSIGKRMNYLAKVNKSVKSVDNKDFFEAIILFSMFVENVSLFSQFLILMSFNKHSNMLKGISNAIEATSKEEIIHAHFGFELVNIIKEENPDWFNEDLIKRVKDITYEAFEAEKEVVEWIYEEGDLKVIPKNVVIEYIKKRLNMSLTEIGIDPIFGVDEEVLKEAEWFDDEITITKLNDFFVKRSVNYDKMSKSVTKDDLF